MNAITVRAASELAKEFLITVQRVHRDEMDKDHEVCLGGKYTAAMKRKSMDLSRVLADLRQGR